MKQDNGMHGRHTYFLKGLCFFAAVVQNCFSAAISYSEDTAQFKNPERGFFVVDKTDPAFLGEAVKKGMTMVRMYYELRAYADMDIIPQSYLSIITKDAENARQAGAKIIPRFIYSRGGTSLNPPLSRILSHINQLAPTLRANSDVIAFMEAGFIGMYGEWHYSQGLPAADRVHTNPVARKAVLLELLKAIPDRMIAMRYNRDKREIFGNVPLEPDSAFSERPATRTGAHNDCFAASTTDVGTYDAVESIEWQKSFLNKDNRYVVQGGENCGGTTYSSCQIAVTDLKRMHWDVLNSAFQPTTLAKWEAEGCLGTIKKYLGYRIKLKSAQLQDAVRPGTLFSGTVQLNNLGWGKIYNARGCELVFRNMATKSKFKVPLASDPRRWFLTDSSFSLNFSALIPATTTEGIYTVYLNLPDTAHRLIDNPAYSIRLANTGTWEDSTGYNSLSHTIMVSKTAPVVNIGSITEKESRFGFAALRKNQAFTFSLVSQTKAKVKVEVLNLAGVQLYAKWITLEPNSKKEISWERPFLSTNLVRIRNGNQYQEVHLVF